MWECETMHDLCNILRVRFDRTDNTLVYACANALSLRPELLSQLSLSMDIRKELLPVAKQMYEAWQRNLTQAEHGFSALGITKESLPLRPRPEDESAHHQEIKNTVARLQTVVTWLSQETPGTENA